MSYSSFHPLGNDWLPFEEQGCGVSLNKVNLKHRAAPFPPNRELKQFIHRSQGKFDNIRDQNCFGIVPSDLMDMNLKSHLSFRFQFLWAVFQKSHRKWNRLCCPLVDKFQVFQYHCSFPGFAFSDYSLPHSP